MKRSRANIAAAALGLLALAIGATLAYHRDVPSTSAPQNASTLFAHTFDDANGQPQAMAQWQGQHLVVNFWATWCAPCVEEMPDLQKVQAEYAQRGVSVVALAIDNAAAVKRFRDDLKLQLPLLVAGATGSELIRELGNPSGALPYTVLIDQRGRIVQSRLGRLRVAELRAWLDQQIGETAKSSPI